MQLTYNQALDTIIDHTEIGYTIASQDRLWIVFIFDLWSDGKWAEMKYNRLYPLPDPDGTSYDMMGREGCLVWTTRAEAEFYAEDWRERVEAQWTASENRHEKPEVYVMNLGDDARYENAVIGHKPSSTRNKPKYKGSEAAWNAIEQMWKRANAERP